MKKLKGLLSFILLFSLSSCSLNDLISTINESKYNYTVKVGKLNNTLKNSKKYIDNALNGNDLTDSYKKEFKEYEENELYSYYYFEKNNNDLAYFNHYMPTTGNVNALVIPIEFKDYPIDDNYNYSNDFEYLPVNTYYYNSSYGKLNLTFDVMDWYVPYYKSTHYKVLKHYYEGSCAGVSQLIDEALTYYTENQLIDLSKYDSNNDNYIDAIYLIYSKPMEDDYNEDFWWAFQYYFLDDNTYDGYHPYSYMFASIDFLKGDNNKIKTDTFIHETGHLLSLEDYYDYDYEEGYKYGKTGSADMMDYNSGDHNCFSKILLGWIDKAIFVTDSQSIQLDFVQDYPICVIIGDIDFDKGIYQSMYLLENYNTKDILNSNTFYDKGSGLRLLHINAELDNNEDIESDDTYFKYDNSYTSKNLLDFIINSKDGIGNLYKNNQIEIEASGNDLILINQTLNGIENDKDFNYSITYYLDKKNKDNIVIINKKSFG